MGKQKKAHMHDAGGNKIVHPADFERRKAKQKLREKRKKNRKENYETKMLHMDPEHIQAEIEEYKEMEKAGKLTKWKKDKMSREMAFYDRLKDKVEQNNSKRLEKEKSDSLHVNFDELKIHRKSSIYYDPVKNPYGAPPTGQVLMYRHPDGSVKREPPPLPASASGSQALTNGLVPGHGDMALPGQRAMPAPAPGDLPEDDEESSGDEEEGSDEAEMDDDEEDDEDDDDDEPMLPGELPDGSKLPPGPPPGAPPSRAHGPPPGAPGLPPLPPGAPPGAPGLPPLPPGLPPGAPRGPPGQAPFAKPQMPFGMPGKGGPPMMPQLPHFGGCGAPQSQAEFAEQMRRMGFAAPPGPPGQLPLGQVPPGPPPGVPPGPPPKPGGGYPQADVNQAPPPPPKTAGGGHPGSEQAGGSSGSAPPGPPPGAKPPPPPPKKAGGAPASAAARAATMFMPTTLRTKKPSQVAGGVIQASAASLSQDARKKVLFTEAPKVAQKVNMDDAFQDFMSQLGEDDE